MGISLEILALLICAPLPRFEPKCLTFCAQPPPLPPPGKLLMHYSCNGSINLPTLSAPISPPAACQDGDSSEGPRPGLHRPSMPVHLRRQLEKRGAPLSLPGPLLRIRSGARIQSRNRLLLSGVPLVTSV